MALWVSALMDSVVALELACGVMTVIVMDDGVSRGYTVFFPGLLSHGRPVFAANLDTVMEYVYVRILVQTCITLILLVLRNDSAMLDTTSLATVVYTVIRITSTKRIRMNVIGSNVTYNIAPISICVDHLSFCVMIACCLVVRNNMGSGYLFFTVPILLFIFAICVAPFYSVYLLRHRRSGR